MAHQKESNMIKKFTYLETKQMEPREGVKYATVYYKQHPKQREEMTKWILQTVKQIGEYAQSNEELAHEIFTPLKGFPKTGKQPNRCLAELLTDIVGECRGVQKNGKPKDFAAAPIERWNKFFKGTQYEFVLEEGSPFQGPQNTFSGLFFK